VGLLGHGEMVSRPLSAYRRSSYRWVFPAQDGFVLRPPYSPRAGSLEGTAARYRRKPLGISNHPVFGLDRMSVGVGLTCRWGALWRKVRVSRRLRSGDSLRTASEAGTGKHGIITDRARAVGSLLIDTAWRVVMNCLLGCNITTCAFLLRTSIYTIG
jgi:hypothetical protein